MNEQDPFQPPHSPLGEEGVGDRGKVSLGILLAVAIFVGSLLVTWVLARLVPFLGCSTLILPFGAEIAAGVVASATGRTRTAKGIWIGFALIVGLILLAIGAIFLACSGMKL